ncbi:Rap1a/Tai family immunity protein [Alphaproteobacteria bacterium LSUCC0226]|jgi:hypothetical protein
MKFRFIVHLTASIFNMLLAGLALAGSNVLFFNGGQLYNMCKDTNTINQAACEGYILGVQDTIYSGYLSQHFNLCFPNGVTPAQLRLQTIKFMEANPNTMNVAAESIIAKVLEVSFACKKEGLKSKDKQ